MIGCVGLLESLGTTILNYTETKSVTWQMRFLSNKIAGTLPEEAALVPKDSKTPTEESPSEHLRDA